MLVPDLNLLVYAFNKDAPHHAGAAEWWENVLNGQERVGIPWLVLTGFIRLLSGKVVIKSPFPAEELFDITDEWLSIPHVTLLEPTSQTYKILRSLMTEMVLPGSMVTDAFIAATAIEHDATLCTNDADFSRFAALKRRNPLSRL